MKRLLFTMILVLLLSATYGSQQYTQTVRGTVIAKETQQPVAWATVRLMVNGNLMGAITDESGHYRLEKVPIGIVTMLFSSVGYESRTIPNVEVSSGRETVLNTELVESVVSLASVEVRATVNKELPLNSFATASARTFSMEEAQRYAGAGYDVSRLAMNFAGVKSTDDTQNEIVIRGNSPIGMLFRLDGIDIPNPNHFGDGSASGGIVSMLNVNTLSNSDFLTGAFPAEYSNTISGVFDLKMRNGNNQQHEFIGQFALMGTELSAEGPLNKNRGSSYLVNYRYSTAQLLNSVIDLQMASLPTYQDGIFKFNFPHKRGTTSVIGFGGTSQIDWIESTRDTTVSKPDMASLLPYDTDEYILNKSGTLGITHTHSISDRSYIKLMLSASTVTNQYRTDSVSYERVVHLWSGSQYLRTKQAMRFFVNTSYNSRNILRMGVSLERQGFQLNDSVRQYSAFRLLRDYEGSEYLFAPYIQWQHRINQQLRFNAGISSTYQHLTQQFAVEPRLGVSWVPAEGNTLSLAYGLHSMPTQAEVLHSYILQPDGSYATPNAELGFTYSQHFVLGYDKMITPLVRLKTELYYQHITNALVEEQHSSFSMLNRRSGSDLDFGALTNNGKGYNYGIELTAEKFMDKGTYFLTTLSLYESKYYGSDNIRRNTAFNGNYVFNLLAGKEFRLGQDKRRYMTRLAVDGKLNLAGGQRYSPIDMEASRAAGYTQYDQTRAWSLQLPAYMNANLRMGIKFTGRFTTQEIAINISNITNRKNPFYLKYDPATDSQKMVYQFGLMPDILYRIMF